MPYYKYKVAHEKGSNEACLHQDPRRELHMDTSLDKFMQQVAKGKGNSSRYS